MEKTTNTELVIFDLDGTLLDTIGDLAVACNACLAVRGLPQHSYEDYCGFVGNGIMRLVERALPEPLRTPENVALVRADFVAYYTAHIDAFTKPYAGIPELLAALTARGVRTAVSRSTPEPAICCTSMLPVQVPVRSTVSRRTGRSSAVK